MQVAPWFWFAAVVLISWGIVGLFQKLSTNYLSGESATFWLIVGFVLFQPFVYPGKSMVAYTAPGVFWGLLAGFLNALGAWAVLAALRSGGRASIVAPFTALYPLAVVLGAPIFLHESVTLLQGLGVLSALVAVVLLSA